MIGLSSSASRRAAWRSRERTRYWCGVTPSTSENSRRKWNGLMPACAAASSRSIGRCEWASIQSAVSTARRRSRIAAFIGFAARPATTSTKRPANSCPTSSRPISLLPSAAACASSPSTINSPSGGTEPIRHTSARSPMVSTSSGSRKNDRHSSPQTWSWVQVYSSPGWPTRIDPATSSWKRPRLWQPKLPLRT